MKSQKGFTLIETLTVLGVLAILGTITALVINPIERLRTTRDANRFSDLRTLQKDLSLFKIDSPSLPFGSSSVVYVSLPDTDPNCANWDLPPLPSGWSYSCKDQANYKKVDGSGWIPVNLTVSNSNYGSGLSTLPADSINNANNYFYYIYDPSSGTYELGTALESDRNETYALNDGGVSPNFWELGTNLALYPTNSIYALVKNESDKQVYNENDFKMYAYAASAGQVSFFTDTNKITGDNNFFWNNSTKYLGIGTNGPNYKLDVQGGQINVSGGLCINGVCKTDWNIPWTNLTSFPSACSPGQYVFAVSSTLICSTPPESVNYWTQSGNYLYASSTSWSVGIGTTNVPYKLAVVRDDGYTSGEHYISTFTNYVGGTGIVLGYRGDGIDSFGSAGLVRATNNRPLVLGTSGTVQAMTILDNGNLGIGSTNPSKKLDVTGDINFTGSLYQNGSPYAGSQWTTSGNNIYYNTGNVGIGTNAPEAKLHVRNDSDTHKLIKLSSGTGIHWNLGVGDASGTYFEIWDGLTSGAPKFVIDKNTGNVGIGTASPGSKLSIAGGNLDLGGNNITGVNKITAVSIDPIFKINGKNYATYTPDFVGGTSVHVFGKEILALTNFQYSYVVDFNNLEENSDLWLFAKTTNFGPKMEKLAVILTPEGEQANLYYQLDAYRNQLIIYGDKPITFSYSLSAPRIDNKDGNNLAEDQLIKGIDVLDYSK